MFSESRFNHLKTSKNASVTAAGVFANLISIANVR